MKRLLGELASYGRVAIGLVGLVMISAALVVGCAVGAASRIPTP
jgi:hypothetical protein